MARSTKIKKTISAGVLQRTPVIHMFLDVPEDELMKVKTQEALEVAVNNPRECMRILMDWKRFRITAATAVRADMRSAKSTL